MRGCFTQDQPKKYYVVNCSPLTFANNNFLPPYQLAQLAVLKKVVTEATGCNVHQRHLIFLPQQLQIPQHHNESTYSVGEHTMVTAVASITERYLKKAL